MSFVMMYNNISEPFLRVSHRTETGYRAGMLPVSDQPPGPAPAENEKPLPSASC